MGAGPTRRALAGLLVFAWLTASAASEARARTEPAPPAVVAGELPGTVELARVLVSQPQGERTLDLAWSGRDMLLVLSPRALGLHRVGGSLEPLARVALQAAEVAVRRPGGMIVADDDVAWASSGAARRAVLFAIAGRSLVHRQDADALPFAGAERGVRWQPGINLLVGPVAGLGPGPFLVLEHGAAVSSDGSLLLRGTDGPRRTGVRVGDALTQLWPGVLAGSSAAPPSGSDTVVVYDVAGPEPAALATLRVDGRVTALAALVDGTRARLAMAVERDGVHVVEVLDAVRGSR